MRKILFRGKRCDNGEWVYGSYVEATDGWHNKGIHKEWICSHARSNGGWFSLGEKHAVISETVGQFTGLTDKNGREIFEWDIVRNGYTNHLGEFYNNGTVVYVENDGCFEIANDECYLNRLTRNMVVQRNIEVISSIHDTPKRGPDDD